MTILCPLLQISEEFNDICQTEIRLMDEWLRYKPRILQLAATKPAIQHLVENLDDMDEGQ